MQKLEQELWNLTMQDAHIAAYASRFNDFAIFCPSLVTPEYKKVERCIWALLQPIQGLVTAFRPTNYDSAKRLAFTLTNQVIRLGTIVLKIDLPGSINSKRKPDEDSEHVAWKKHDLGKVCVATISSPTPSKAICRRSSIIQ